MKKTMEKEAYVMPDVLVVKLRVKTALMQVSQVGVQSYDWSEDEEE